MAYWQDRMASAQNKISNKSVRAIETQMRRYYAQTMKKVIADFEATYDKLLATIEAGKEPTPADLYKLDKYWQLQAQARAELEKLGAKQVALLSKQFELNWFEIYHSISLPGTPAFNTLDSRLVEQMISQIWCADGKSWSQRIWGNTNALLDELNEGLIHIVASGKKNTELKQLLQERFGVSYSRADALVRTEVAHIQTQAAQKRYEDYGVKMVEVWADLDERRCDVCGKLHQTKHPINGAMPIPAHTNCRCCIVPVVE
jgi:SPP1 gp7 family putative phage head morphogenesis protein